VPRTGDNVIAAPRRPTIVVYLDGERTFYDVTATLDLIYKHNRADSDRWLDQHGFERPLDDEQPNDAELAQYRWAVVDELARYVVADVPSLTYRGACANLVYELDQRQRPPHD
jgi:hypothetical protein